MSLVAYFHTDILNWDTETFRLINETGSTPFLDAVLPWTREKLIWTPFYGLIIYIWIRKYQAKGWVMVLILALTIGVSDILSSQFIKLYFHRLRPCTTGLLPHIKLRIPCGSGFSFVSSHASNHFAIAAFIGLWLRKTQKYLEPWIYLWAGIISYAQIYVGVHYPLDVLSGGLLGLVIGWSSGYLTFTRNGYTKLSLANDPNIDLKSPFPH